MSDEYSVDHFPCGVCGNRRFIFGAVRDGQLKSAWFEAADRTMRDKMRGWGKSEITARMCKRCRHVEMFAREGDFEPPPIG